MSVKKPIRVALVEHQPEVRERLSGLLLAGAGLQLVGNAEDAEEAIQLCELVQPEVVLMGLRLPGPDGVETTRRILQRWPLTRVVVLASAGDEELVRQALESGACGSLAIDGEERNIEQVIMQACASAPEAPRKFVSRSPSNRLPEGRRALSRELADAARVQASFMPVHAPRLPGWDLSARLVPARETSGDFYDFIPLPNGNLGIVIADVTDKGIGAALFMAMSSTLIRTYASLYPTLPAFVMGVVNQRILEDTGGSMHVTAFYGVLEPAAGRLRYVNAGHNPPYLLSNRKGKPFDRLKATGTPLGVMENNYFQQKVIKLAAGDTLLLYTDGIVEARNPLGSYFGDQRLLATARSAGLGSARDLQEAIFSAVVKFSAGAPVGDDMALLVLTRSG